MSVVTGLEWVGVMVALGYVPLAWKRRRYVRVIGALGVGLGLGDRISLWVPVLTVILGAGWVWSRRARTVSIVSRWGRISRRKHGVASTLDILRHASGGWAMHRKTGVVRPFLATRGWWARWSVPTAEIAVLMCRVGWARVWALIEHVTLVFGGPRKGKTGWLAARIIDAPGAVLATSTRTDLYTLTAPLRRSGGRPVFVFNAAGLGQVPSTISFDPLTGCADPTAALERATDLLGAGTGGGSSERDYWVGLAREVLGALLHAAALGGLSMHTVLEWVADTDTAYREITTLLRRSPMPSFVHSMKAFLGTNEKTRTSVTASMRPALEWLGAPAAVAATTGAVPFDVTRLLRERGTVYLLGAQEAHTAPLLAALTGYIAREARRIAAGDSELACRGRLDPPLTLALDECALICRVPLDDWTADMGGRGVSIIACFQSRIDMINRWGEHGAGRIMNNAGTIMLFGGTKDERDLRHWQALAGHHDIPVETTDATGNITSRSARETPTFTVTQLANLPPFRVLVFAPGMPVVIGWVTPAWKRTDVKTITRASARQTREARTAVLADAEQVTTHTTPSSDRWVVEGEGRTHPTTDTPHPGYRAALNGRVAGHHGGGDATH